MKLFITILIFILSVNCFAHKDIYVHKTYGNVKVFLKTGFKYSDIDKIQIIGQLSEKLSNHLHYKDTIFIEYIQDYTDKYNEDVFQLEYNNSNYKWFASIKAENQFASNNLGLSVRIYADKINIIDVLKLVEFTILNKEKTNFYLTPKSIHYNSYEDQELKSELSALITDDSLINDVLSTQSKLISKLINEKILVYGQDKYGIEIYWQNDKFLFEYNNIWSEKQDFIFELPNYYYSVFVNQNEVLIFVNQNSFYYLNGKDTKEKKMISFENGNYIPVSVMNFGDKLLLQSYWTKNNISIFLKEKNKVISKFE